MTTVRTSLDELCVHALRALSIDAVERAKSGHPGLPMGAAPMAYVLWQRHLVHDPTDPRWFDRDRFVLSAGHGSALYYSLLHAFGYPVSLDDLRAFRQWGSATPGHPEAGATPGVEATTGPLGQGAANSVGMAIAERALAARFDRPGHTVVDHFTYALVSDGDLMEGVVAEAASLAGELALGKLIWLYDSNDVSLDGPTALTFGAEDVAARFRAYGWHVQRVEDGDRDLDAIDRAIVAAKAERSRPSLIIVRTTIGFGAPKKAGTADAHGSPLGADEAAAAKESYGLGAAAAFEIPRAALERFRGAAERGAARRRAWERSLEAYAAAHPDLAAELRRRIAGELAPDFAARCTAELPRWKAGESLATRDAGGKAENALARIAPELFGGDADLASSTKTSIAGGGSFSARDPSGRNVHFGVREHAMGSIANGIAYHGGLRPFASTFFVFADYMRPPVRLAAMCHLPVIWVWTHDSVAVGEDGPTHQPVEHLASLRAIPGLRVIRPADANETAHAWRFALEALREPVALILSRQKLPVLAGTDERAAEGVRRGAYVLSEASGGAPQVILIATGSEVALALVAQARLAQRGVRARVVSMPCWRSFEVQDRAHRDAVLPPQIRARVSIEAASTFGWERWIGSAGIALGIDRFGASAPGEIVLEKLGITVERAVEAALAALERASAP